MGSTTAGALVLALSVLAAARASADPEPTLGQVWASSQQGYGSVRPARISNGGDPTGTIWDVTWSSWGGAQAIGHGTSYWTPLDGTTADSLARPATIVAYQLGMCHGTLMYRAAKWYFPGEGESFEPAGHYDICDGGYLDGI